MTQKPQIELLKRYLCCYSGGMVESPHGYYYKCYDIHEFLEEIKEVIEGLADQQAMSDLFYEDTLNKINQMILQG